MIAIIFAWLFGTVVWVVGKCACGTRTTGCGWCGWCGCGQQDKIFKCLKIAVVAYDNYTHKHLPCVFGKAEVTVMHLALSIAMAMGWCAFRTGSVAIFAAMAMVLPLYFSFTGLILSEPSHHLDVLAQGLEQTLRTLTDSDKERFSHSAQLPQAMVAFDRINKEMQGLLAHDHGKELFITTEEFVVFMATFFNPPAEHTPLRIRRLSVQMAGEVIEEYDLFEMRAVKSTISVEDLGERGFHAFLCRDDAQTHEFNLSVIKLMGDALISNDDSTLQSLARSGDLPHALVDETVSAAVSEALCTSFGRLASPAHMDYELRRQEEDLLDLIIGKMMTGMNPAKAQEKIHVLLDSMAKACPKLAVGALRKVRQRDSALADKISDGRFFQQMNALKDNAAGMSMGKLLNESPEIVAVNLESTGMTCQGLEGLNKGLTTPSLRWHSFSVGKNADLLKEDGEMGGRLIVKILNKCPSLATVNLSDIDMSMASLQQLSDYLAPRLPWKTLNLFWNKDLLTSGSAGRAVGTVLAACPDLEDVNFRATGMIPEALHALVQQFAETSSLAWKRLIVGQNTKLLTTPDAGKDMGKLLAKCHDLGEIKLFGTGMTPDALDGLAEELKGSPSLPWRSLNVYGNDKLLKTPKACEAMGKLLAKCPNLGVIDLGGTGLTDEAKQSLVAKLPSSTRVKG